MWRVKEIRIVVIVLVSVIMGLASVSVSYSGYLITQLTDSSYNPWNPKINDNGQVAWVGVYWVGGYGDYNIFRYDGTSITNITNNLAFNGTGDPQMNDSGYVVWEGYDGSDYEIFLYDGTSIRQVTDSSGNYLYGNFAPQINNSGQVVWHTGDGDIFLYDGATITNISNNTYDFDNHNPRMNDKGYVVWEAQTFYDYSIFLYDGTISRAIRTSPFLTFDPQINNNGQVVWKESDGSDWEIFLYDATGIKQITNNSYDDNNPKINDNGYIVWEEYDGSDWEIFLYDGSSITQITNNSYHDYHPQINNNGQVVWYSYKGGQITDIFLATPSINAAVHLVIPNGGDVLPSGGIYAVCWNAPSNAVKFDLMYSINNGASWNFIKTVKGLNCTHWEEIPVVTASKKQCLVKVVGYDSASVKVGEDVSDNPFTIEVLRLTSPNGGETLKSATTWVIKWVTNKTIRPVAKTVLKYTTDGITWNPIKTLAGNPGTYNWTVPSVLSTKTRCKVKVILKDAGGVNIGTDVSDKAFTIQP